VHRFIQISFPILFIATDILLLKIILCDAQGAPGRVVSPEMCDGLFYKSPCTMSDFDSMFVRKYCKELEGYTLLLFSVCKQNSLKILIFRKEEVTAGGRPEICGYP
jgi:hypothetical protein